MSYFRRVGNLADNVSLCSCPCLHVLPCHAHLVEVLEEIEDTASDLLLVEASRGVAPDGGDAAHGRGCSESGERSDGAAEGGSRVGSGAGLGDGASAADNGGAEHGGGDVCGMGEMVQMDRAVCMGNW